MYIYETSKAPIIRPKTTTTSLTTIPSGKVSNTSTSVSTTISPIAVCISSLQTVPISNGNFSTGTYADWNVTGYGFGSAPLNLTNANKQGGYYAAPWSNFGNNTFAATTFQKGLAVQPGNLTSNPFLVTEPFLNFKVISSQNDNIYIEILQAGKPRIIVHYNTYAAPGNINAESTFENASIPLSTLACKNVSIRLVFIATGTSTTNYLAATDFYLSKTPVSTPGIVINQTFT
ncbi:MAG: hypothetical protein QW257_02485 [Candidatus Micrarchaeaceae archaeon]